MDRFVPREHFEIEAVDADLSESYLKALGALRTAADRLLPLELEAYEDGNAAEPCRLTYDATEGRLQIVVGKNTYLVFERLRDHFMLLTPESVNKLAIFLAERKKEKTRSVAREKVRDVSEARIHISSIRSMHATAYVEVSIDGRVVSFVSHTPTYGWQYIFTKEALAKNDTSSPAYVRYGWKVFEKALEHIRERYPDGPDEGVF